MQQYLLFIMTNLISLELCEAGGIVSVKLVYFNNPEGKTDEGKCCDPMPFCWARSTCDPIFTVCLDEPNGSSTDMGQCRIGRYVTGYTLDRNQIKFSQYIGKTPNHKELQFHTWPGTVHFKVQASDYDRLGDIKSDELMEFHSTEIQMDASRSRAEARWRDFQVKKRTLLDFKMAVFCDENWYGPKCDVNCESSNIDLVHDNCTSDRPKKCQAVEPRNTSETALPQLIPSLSDRDYINDNNPDTCMAVSSQHAGSFLTFEIQQKPPLQIILKLKAVPSCEQSNLFVFTPNMVQCPLTNSTNQNGISSCVYSCIDKCSNRVTVGFQKAKFDPQSWQICEVAEMRNPNGLMTSCC